MTAAPFLAELQSYLPSTTYSYRPGDDDEIETRWTSDTTVGGMNTDIQIPQPML